MKLLGMTLLIIFSISKAQATTMVCRTDIDSSSRRTVVVGDVFMICESPKTIDLNGIGMKNKYCAASMLLIGTSENRSTGGRILGITTNSVLNNLNSDTQVNFSYSNGGSNITGHLKLSNNLVISIPALNVPVESDYICERR